MTSDDAADAPDLEAPAARAPACAACGAPLPISLARADVACAHCGAVATMDADLRARMRAYVGDVRRYVDAEVTARFAAAAYAKSEQARVPVLFGAVGLAYTLALGGVALFAALGGIHITTPIAVILGALWLASVAAFTIGWRAMFAVPPPAAAAAQSIAKCARCGAVRDVKAGQAAAACRHCGGTVLVPSLVAAQLLARARVTADDAVQREAAQLARGDYGQSLVKPLVTLVVVGVPVGLGAGAWLVARGGAAVSPGVLGAIFGAPFAAALPWLVHAPFRGRGERRRIAPLVDQLVAAADDDRPA